MWCFNSMLLVEHNRCCVSGLLESPWRSMKISKRCCKVTRMSSVFSYGVMLLTRWSPRRIERFLHSGRASRWLKMDTSRCHGKRHSTAVLCFLIGDWDAYFRQTAALDLCPETTTSINISRLELSSSSADCMNTWWVVTSHQESDSRAVLPERGCDTRYLRSPRKLATLSMRMCNKEEAIAEYVPEPQVEVLALTDIRFRANRSATYSTRPPS